jgi:membrane-bound metal-dependent hydrolase YbcI (DUF457 family)
MIFFGHLGIGSKLASPWSRDLPVAPLLLGTILPDLIDKSLYYSLCLITGKRGVELGLISGTRTLGHTAIFMLVLAGIAFFKRSKWFAALALGVATHLLLDNVSDTFRIYTDPFGSHERPALIALLWPFYQWQFAVSPFMGLKDHLGRSMTAFNIGAEIVGVLILAWDWWKNRHESEILQQLRMKRWRKRGKIKNHKI